MARLSFIVAFVAATIAAAYGGHWAKQLNTEQVLSRHMSPPQEPMQFKWDSCGSTALVDLKELTISPDPITFNQNLTVSASVAITKAISSGKIQLKIQKKILGVYTDIPCVDGVGSCTYDDFCSLLPNKPCPPPLPSDGLPCTCPFNGPATYTLPPTSFFLKMDNSIPSWLTSGDYYVKSEFSNGDGSACFEIYISLAK